MAITVNKEFWTEFIGIYRTLPCLWDTKDENYTNRESRSTALYKLVEKLQEVEPDANQDSVKRKINTFRSNFNREVRKIRQTEKEQPNEEYHPTLWYFDHLSFLLNQEKYKNNSSSVSTIDENYDGGDMTMSSPTIKCEMSKDSDILETASIIQEETSHHSENSQEIYNGEICRNKQKSGAEIENLIEYSPVRIFKTGTKSHNDNTASIQSNHIINRKRLRSSFNKITRSRVRFQDPHTRSYNRDVCSIADEAALFGQTWACEFRKLNSQQKLFAKKAIDEILVLGQLNVLKLQTVPINKTLMEMEDE